MTALEAPLVATSAPTSGSSPPPVWLARLTDEELVLLGNEHPVVVLPHYEQLPPASQEVAVRTAHRSLHAHGIDLSADGRGLMLPQEVSDLLDVRAGAEWVLVVRRCETVEHDDGAGHRSTELYAHVVDDFVLLEEVTADGVHEFRGLERGALALALADGLSVTGAVDGRGEPIRLDLEGIAHGRGDVDLTQLGPVLLQIDATVWRRGPQPAPMLLGIMVGTQGSWATRAQLGAQGPVVLDPVAADAAADLVVDLLGRALDRPAPMTGRAR